MIQKSVHQTGESSTLDFIPFDIFEYIQQPCFAGQLHLSVWDILYRLQNPCASVSSCYSCFCRLLAPRLRLWETACVAPAGDMPGSVQNLRSHDPLCSRLSCPGGLLACCSGSSPALKLILHSSTVQLSSSNPVQKVARSCGGKGGGRCFNYEVKKPR
jgi:hypothetical protein